MDSAFKAHRKLIKKLAGKYSRKTGIEFEDLEAEGNRIFVEAYLAYNPEKAKFSTYLFHWLTNELTKYCSHYRTMTQHEAISFEAFAEDSENAKTITDKIFSVKDNTEKEILFADELSKLSTDAKTVADMIFQGQLIRRADKTKCLKEIGWNKNRIFRAQREIKTFLKAVKYEIC